MESPASPPLHPRRRTAVLIAAAALLAYAFFLLRHVHAVAGGSDSSGYMNHAWLLASGHVRVPPRPLPGLNAANFSDFLYSPLGFKPQDGMLVPTYPVGVPLLILAVRPFAGWAHAGDLMIILHGLAGLLLTYAIGRALKLSAAWSLFAAGALAASPLYIEFSLQAMSDLPALVWSAAAALTAWRARRRLRWALAAGFFTSVAVLIRPTDVLILVPIALAWLPRRGGWGRASLRVLWYGAGGIPGAAFFCLHSHAAYGRYLTTGYGDAMGLFQMTILAQTLRSYVVWMPVLFAPLVWLWFGLPWAKGPLAKTEGGNESEGALGARSFLAGWVLVYLGFYSLYFHTHEAWWYERFILPAGPAIILGWVWVARAICGALRARGWLRPATAAIGAALAVALLLAFDLDWDSRFAVTRIGEGEATYPLAMNWLNENAPRNAVVVAMQTSGAAYYYTDFPILRYDQISAATFPQVARAAARDHRPIYAPLFAFETEAALRHRMPGLWQPVAKLRDITIWRWQDSPARR